MRSRSALPILLLSFSFPLSLPLQSQSPKPVAEKIVNGLTDNLHPTVGLFSTNGGECSATLIGCQTVLTAAHCICTLPNGDDVDGATCATRSDLVTPAGKSVFFQHAGTFTLSRVAVDPAYIPGTQSDLAILHLSAPVPNIAPSPINRVSRPPFGLAGEIVGFGTTLGRNSDDGIKRKGNVVTAACAPPSSRFVCWNFSNPLGSPGTNSDTCFGDSGGPLFLSLGGQTVLAGVTSGGTSPNCQPLDNSNDDDVFSDLVWIQTEAGADLNASSCGSGPQIGGAGTSVLGSSGTLTNGQNQVASSVEVPVGTTELRVALNSQDWFENSNALYIRHGAPVSTTAFDCKSAVLSGQQFCDVKSPASGTWNILARHISGPGGAFQVTASLIGQATVAPSLCIPGPTTLCLNGGRFKVEGTFNTGTQQGQAQAIKLTDETGYFWFFSNTNVEMVIKVLNACPLSQTFWVFAGGLTNVQTTITVTDSNTGVVKTYSNPQGAAFQPVQDTSAFATCP
ncbi:MAG TPA: trypsin-like serine protease [Thermoanaerobaculia bacterium]|nr:trypsin-like serine protease [Thermoanaerobaculia bacterium]